MGRPSSAIQRLQQATLELIWQRSCGAVTTELICSKAKVLPGTLYHFYHSKSSLIASALEAYWAEHQSDLSRVFDRSKNPNVRIRDYFARLAERAQQQQVEHGRVLGCPFVSIGSEVGKQDAVISEAVLKIIKQHRKYFRDTVTDGISSGAFSKCNVQQTVREIGMMVAGCVTAARIHNDPQLCQLMGRRIVEMLQSPHAPSSSNPRNRIVSRNRKVVAS